MVIPNFSFYQTPIIRFGPGEFCNLVQEIERFGKRTLIVIGGSSFKNSDRYNSLHRQLTTMGLLFDFASIANEPTPSQIDAITRQYRKNPPHSVVAIGGGSVLDSGKALSAMLTVNGSVYEYLEGVGSKIHPGTKIPYIAVPTTAGTGSEATKNAVLCEPGEGGFKKSLRHDSFIPNIAIIDPELTQSIPKRVMANCGMDAFSQLIESYTSIKANPLTDSLAIGAMPFIINHLLDACDPNYSGIEAYSAMSYAALISGITLANAGLGIVHGIAGPMGGLFPIPHGSACGSLLVESIKVTLEYLQQDPKKNAPHLQKFARVGSLCSSQKNHDTHELCQILVDKITSWREALEIPKLSQFGINTHHIQKIVKNSEQKSSPIQLPEEAIAKIVQSSI